MSVNELLAQSRAAHQRYYQHHQQWDAASKTWSHGDLSAARAALEAALSLRDQAHDADPEHTDHAWSEDAAPHEDILAFYVGRLTSTDL